EIGARGIYSRGRRPSCGTAARGRNLLPTRSVAPPPVGSHAPAPVLATVLSCALVGIEAHPVQVEVDLTAGLPHTATVGLPDHVVRESKDRVRSALRNSGFDIPPRRITVNLAPAHLRKEGAAYDLPIALGILAAPGHETRHRLAGVVVAGELALDGAVRP